MATAKWWVCDSCRSLNDIPANKCYKCRTQKPSQPTLIDADYVRVGSTQTRVGVTVDRSMVAELTAPQEVETRPGTGVFEAYGAMDDQPLESVRTAGEPKAPPPPLREPPSRSIAQVGGYHWEHGLAEADRRLGLGMSARPSPTPAAAPPRAGAAAPMQAGHPAGPGMPPGRPSGPPMPPAPPTQGPPPPGLPSPGPPPGWAPPPPGPPRAGAGPSTGPSGPSAPPDPSGPPAAPGPPPAWPGPRPEGRPPG
jgi:hypothetical protein